MRSFDELRHAAIQLREKLLAEGREPLDSVFTVTQHELCVLMDQPWHRAFIDHAEARFYGFKLHVIS